MAVKRWNGTAWEVYAGADLAPVKVTDGRPGKTTFIGATSPTGQVDGDIWIDQDTTTNAVVPTALTTKGDTFVATGNAAYTRLAAGNNGESLFADSSTSTGLRWQEEYTVGKNILLNGNFSIWQRGTSSASGGYQTADRWWHINAGTTTVAQETSDLPPGTRYGIKWTTGASSSYGQIIQSIETATVIPLRGKTLTLSAWVKVAGTFTGVIQPELNYTNTNIDGGYSQMGSGSIAWTGAGVATTSWTRASWTFVMPSDATGIRIGIIPTVVQASGAIVRIANIQLEVGSVATAFTTNTANPQAELAACQRYFIRYTPNSAIANTMYFASGNAISTTRAMVSVSLPTNLRAIPSLTKTSGVALYNQGSNYYWNTTVGPISSVYQASQNFLNLDCWVPSGLTNNTPVMISLVGANDYLDFSAEI
jgi:hypothetical protein